MKFTPAATANLDWGFWGTSVRNGYDAELTWDAASHFLAEEFDLTAEQARDVLDARFGRHLPDDLSFIDNGAGNAKGPISLRRNCQASHGARGRPRLARQL